MYYLQVREHIRYGEYREKRGSGRKQVYGRVSRIVESRDSDSLEKGRFYLEAEKINETILLPSLEIIVPQQMKTNDLFHDSLWS